MKYGNELKVGVAVLVSILIFFFGIRYFQDVPLFSGTYELVTSFPQAEGLVNGNPVRISGVRVGAIDQVRLDPESREVRVRFHLDEEIRVPEGSTTKVSGIAAFGTVTVDLNLGPPSNPEIPDGGFVPSQQDDALGDLLDQAPQLVNQADTLLLGATAAIGEAEQLLANPQSDLRQMLVAIQASAASLDRLLRSEQQRIASTLESVDTLAASLAVLTSENQDSLSLVVQNLNQTLDQLDRNLASLETTTGNLDALLTKINDGEGTLGLLVNDPSLYRNLDSTVTTMNALLLDIQRNPKRYLKDLRLVDVF